MKQSFQIKSEMQIISIINEVSLALRFYPWVLVQLARPHSQINFKQ
ncbi:unnamed protein product [Paramecium octaurelia]|uniref:Uncharacterized protein n=1 Tax=Paramecium octaurelia TaxID=43137 RepID=A0A8S1UJC8_PAROT|nr:unnamed protein product [Paramecium octaurelia]